MSFSSFSSSPPASPRFSPRGRAIRRLARLAAIGAACAAWTPADAAANEFGIGVGPYVSLVFGEEVGIGYGLDATLLIAPDAPECNAGLGRGWGIGPTFQLGGINASAFQLVAALAAGGAVPDNDGLGIVGEAGVALLTSKGASRWGLHTGVSFQSPYFAYGFARAEWLLDSYSLGGGARFPALFNMDATCSEGRPLRGEDGRLIASAAESVGDALKEDATLAAGAADREALAAAWSRDAISEAASVPAFLQLGGDLLALGAPDALVDEAISAAEDEVRHARACAGIASRLARRRIAPALPAYPLRAPLTGADGLQRIAIESWLDGCLGEGAAAGRAALAARRAAPPCIATARRDIAREERRHAALSWKVLAWAAARGGDEVRDAVHAARGATIDAADEGLAERDARVFGRVGRADAEALHARHATRARGRLDALLA
jgi:hypothetical protein